MLCVWWDIKGILYYELLNPNETTTANFAQVEDLKLAIAEKHPVLVIGKGVIFHHNSACLHVVITAQEKFR
jgi:hypothetical protein